MTYDHLDMKHLQDSIGKWVRRNGVHLNPHPEPHIMGFDKFLYFSILLTMCCHF